MPATDRRKGETVVLAALAAGQTTTQAAEAAGVNPRTVRRWLEDDEFRDQVAQLRRDMLTGTVGQLTDAATQAVATLRDMLSANSEQVRVSAARAILSALVVVRESVDLEQRIDALEAEAERKKS